MLLNNICTSNSFLRLAVVLFWNQVLVLAYENLISDFSRNQTGQQLLLHKQTKKQSEIEIAKLE